MYYDPDKHHRKSYRLKGHDYSKADLYFFTLICKNRKYIFGKIRDKKMILNELGKIADQEWQNTVNVRDNIVLHEYIIMPNHMHGIIEITGMSKNPGTASRTKGVWPYAQSFDPTQIIPSPSPSFKSPSKTLGAIIRGYKGAVTKKVNILRGTPGVPVWQRNYWERRITNELSYLRISEYIINNPRNEK